MVSTVKSHYINHHQEEEEADGDELALGTMVASSNRGFFFLSLLSLLLYLVYRFFFVVRTDGKNSDQRTNSSRSKHSKTEQRRRSKINERFQILKDLIPPNDQRRDKASLLLEVIEYVQFLQEKVQMYEGSCQGLSQESTKLMPWRSSHGLGESYSDHSHLKKNGCGHENNVVQPVGNMHSIVQSDFGGDAYEGADHVSEPTSAAPINMSLLPNIYSGRSALTAENLASQPELHVWHGESSVVGCTTTANTMSMQDKTHKSSLSNISVAYSQGLLKGLTDALQTSGVDLSQANFSVQLDVGKCENISRSLSTSAPEYPGKGLSSDRPLMHHRENNAEDPNQDAKRFRTGEN